MHSIIGGRSAMSEEKAMIKVAALCGSLRKASFNRGLLRAAIELSQEQITGLHVEFIDTSSLPMLNTDLEQNGRFPPEVEEFRQKILEADCCFFASPDYNYSVTPLVEGLKLHAMVTRVISSGIICFRKLRDSLMGCWILLHQMSHAMKKRTK